MRISHVVENLNRGGLERVVIDLVKAQMWFNVAFARGCDRAAAHRQELALEMDRDQIASALREARAFLTRH